MMDANQATDLTKTEKGTQTDASFLASVPDGDISDDSPESESSGPLADGNAADGDIEKQEPLYYDKDTFLVRWSDSNDRVCEPATVADLRL
jgi:hypothetical protein